MRISPNRWNIIQRIIREYPQAKDEIKEIEGESVYILHLKREVAAIEEALSLFSEPEQMVVRERFWSDPEKYKSYEPMYDTGYSPRQMRRICYRMIILTGKRLGHIE